MCKLIVSNLQPQLVLGHCHCSQAINVGRQLLDEMLENLLASSFTMAILLNGNLANVKKLECQCSPDFYLPVHYPSFLTHFIPSFLNSLKVSIMG